MATVRINTGSDAVWARAWEVDDAAGRIALLATYTDPFGPKRGDMIVQLDTSTIYLVIGANLAIPINPIDLEAAAADVTGILPVANGGTGIASLTANRIPFGNGTSPFQSDADLTFDGSELNVNALIDISGAAGGQIQFPASQNSSGNANTLDDYEEGTWTPSIAFGGATTGITYTNQAGTYTKIGRQVTVCGLIGLSSKGTATGAATLEGLPYALSNSGIGFITGNKIVYDAFTAGVQEVGIQGGGSGGTSLSFNKNAAGTNTLLADTDFTNSTAVVTAFHYYTD